MLQTAKPGIFEFRKTENCLDKNHIFQTTRFNHTIMFFKLID